MIIKVTLLSMTAQNNYHYEDLKIRSNPKLIKFYFKTHIKNYKITRIKYEYLI